MQRFLHGCHSLPVAAAAGRLAGQHHGAPHVAGAHRVCLACGAVGDEMHLIFECTALASLRSRYASLCTGSTDTIRYKINFGTA